MKMVSFDYAAKIHFFYLRVSSVSARMHYFSIFADSIAYCLLPIAFCLKKTTMIKNKQDIRIETVENQGNIEGRIQKNIVLTPAEMLERASMFNIITLPSGSRIKEHPHIEDAEIYYILEGEAEVTDDGRTAIMHAGDVMFTGNGARHSIANHSGKDVRFLACILKM